MGDAHQRLVAENGAMEILLQMLLIGGNVMHDDRLYRAEVYHVGGLDKLGDI